MERKLKYGLVAILLIVVLFFVGKNTGLFQTALPSNTYVPMTPLVYAVGLPVGNIGSINNPFIMNKVCIPASTINADRLARATYEQCRQDITTLPIFRYDSSQTTKQCFYLDGVTQAYTSKESCVNNLIGQTVPEEQKINIQIVSGRIEGIESVVEPPVIVPPVEPPVLPCSANPNQVGCGLTVDPPVVQQSDNTLLIITMLSIVGLIGIIIVGVYLLRK